MPKVWADNEEVLFNEGIPDNSQQIYELLMGALSEQRRAVVEFLVDGEDALASNSFPEKFDVIKASSMTHDEITLRLTKATLEQTEKLDVEIDAYSKNILSTPWSVVVKQMDQFISKIQPFADLIDNVSPYANAYNPEWASSLNDIAKEQANCLTFILQAFENNNPASLSDEIGVTFLPLIKKIKNLFLNDVIPQLEEMVNLATNPAS
jgi:hypothetical protein